MPATPVGDAEPKKKLSLRTKESMGSRLFQTANRPIGQVKRIYQSKVIPPLPKAQLNNGYNSA